VTKVDREEKKRRVPPPPPPSSSSSPSSSPSSSACSGRLPVNCGQDSFEQHYTSRRNSRRACARTCGRPPPRASVARKINASRVTGTQIGLIPEELGRPTLSDPFRCKCARARARDDARAHALLCSDMIFPSAVSLSLSLSPCLFLCSPKLVILIWLFVFSRGPP